MDIFAGCGGLSEGFQQARAAVCKWAIEYEHPAAEAFKLNHPDAHVMCDNCNVILTAAMHKAGLQDLCKASPEVGAYLVPKFLSGGDPRGTLLCTTWNADVLGSEGMIGSHGSITLCLCRKHSTTDMQSLCRVMSHIVAISCAAAATDTLGCFLCTRVVVKHAVMSSSILTLTPLPHSMKLTLIIDFALDITQHCNSL